MQTQTKAHNARVKEQCLFEEMYKMQLQIHWEAESNFEAKTLATGQTLKQGRQDMVYTNTSDFREFEGHDIDWKNQVIFDKESDMFKRRIKEAIYIRASEVGCFINPDNGTPVNNCWDKFNNIVKINMRKKNDISAMV